MGCTAQPALRSFAALGDEARFIFDGEVGGVKRLFGWERGILGVTPRCWEPGRDGTSPVASRRLLCSR